MGPCHPDKVFVPAGAHYVRSPERCFNVLLKRASLATTGENLVKISSQDEISVGRKESPTYFQSPISQTAIPLSYALRGRGEGPAA
jgi:hypothetical protein